MLQRGGGNGVHGGVVNAAAAGGLPLTADAGLIYVHGPVRHNHGVDAVQRK